MIPSVPFSFLCPFFQEKNLFVFWFSEYSFHICHLFFQFLSFFKLFCWRGTAQGYLMSLTGFCMASITLSFASMWILRFLSNYGFNNIFISSFPFLSLSICFFYLKKTLSSHILLYSGNLLVHFKCCLIFLKNLLFYLCI